MQIHIFISVLLLCWTPKENENRPDGAIPTSERARTYFVVGEMYRKYIVALVRPRGHQILFGIAILTEECKYIVIELR